MGEMHEIIKAITAKDIAKRERKTVRTIQARFAKLYPGETFDCNAILSPDQERELSRKPERKATRKAAPPVGEIQRHVPDADAEKLAADYAALESDFQLLEFKLSQMQEQAPADQPRPWKLPRFDLSALLAIVVYAHTGLVWYEVATIFMTPGLLAGVILAAMKHAAVVVTRSGKFADTAFHALAAAFLLDVLAWYVHYRSFFQALKESRYMTDMGQDSYTAAAILAGVVCSGAFVSLFLIFKLNKK